MLTELVWIIQDLILSLLLPAPHPGHGEVSEFRRLLDELFELGVGHKAKAFVTQLVSLPAADIEIDRVGAKLFRVRRLECPKVL